MQNLQGQHATQRALDGMPSDVSAHNGAAGDGTDAEIGDEAEEEGSPEFNSSHTVTSRGPRGVVHRDM